MIFDIDELAWPRRATKPTTRPPLTPIFFAFTSTSIFSRCRFLFAHIAHRRCQVLISAIDYSGLFSAPPHASRIAHSKAPLSARLIYFLFTIIVIRRRKAFILDGFQGPSLPSPPTSLLHDDDDADDFKRRYYYRRDIASGSIQGRKHSRCQPHLL